MKQEDNRRLFHNAALRKRRKEMGDQVDLSKRSSRVCSKFLDIILSNFCSACMNCYKHNGDIKLAVHLQMQMRGDRLMIFHMGQTVARVYKV